MRGRKPADSGAFWISYSDLATALLLVFILLVFVSMAQSAKDRRDVREEVERLLGTRESLATRLEAAVQSSNDKLKSQVFEYDEGVVTVRESIEAAWFEPRRAELQPIGQQQLTVFYEELYTFLLGPELPDGLPQFLASINIEGHTDPASMSSASTAPFDWPSYNGTGQHERDSNLHLSQARAKAIIDHIQSLYTDPATAARYADMPWRPFAALAQATGRSWTKAYHITPSGHFAPMEPSDFLTDPSRSIPSWQEDELYARSRRVTFSFEIDDAELLEALKAKWNQMDGSRDEDDAGS